MSNQRFRPFAVIGRCWLPEIVELAPGLAVEPLEMTLSFENELDFVIALAEKLEIEIAPKFRGTAMETLAGAEPAVLARFPEIVGKDFDEAVAQLKPDLELACDALAYLTTNAVVPFAVILTAGKETFRARFFPPTDRATIYLGEWPAKIPQVVVAAQATGEIRLALSLLRSGTQASTLEFRLFYFIEALEVLSGLVGGGGGLAVRIRRLLKHVSIKPMPTRLDPRKDHADVLAELRNVVGHGRRLGPTAVQPWAAEYLGVSAV